MARDVFDSINDFFQNVYQQVQGQSHFSGDPKLDTAWQELDDFMASSSGYGSTLDEFDQRLKNLGYQPKAEHRTQQAESQKSNANNSNYQEQSRRSFSSDEQELLQLAKDYRNLEIEIGSSQEIVKTAYKKMLLKYHPDKFASTPDKQSTATEITTKLNESYARITAFLAKRDKKQAK